LVKRDFKNLTIAPIVLLRNVRQFN